MQLTQRLQWTPRMRAELAEEAARVSGSDCVKARAVSVLLSERWGVPLTYDAARYALGEQRRRASVTQAILQAKATPPAVSIGHATPATSDDVDVLEIEDASPAEPTEPKVGATGIYTQQAREPERQVYIPAVHTGKSRAENYLIISDAQLPYQHPGALRFCQQVRTEFGIPLENILCVGDEFDFYFASRFDKSPDAPHTPKQEIEAGREEVARWVAAFPEMRLCYSNHGARLRSAAHRANLPIGLIRNIRDVYGLPEGWRYAEHWIVAASKHPFRVEHGHVGPGGHAGLRGRPLNRQISTAWGHEHVEPAAIHIDTHGGGQRWGMRTGSLLTKEPVPAFAYNTEQGSRPVGSVGVVLDGGRLPLIVRM